MRVTLRLRLGAIVTVVERRSGTGRGAEAAWQCRWWRARDAALRHALLTVQAAPSRPAPPALLLHLPACLLQRNQPLLLISYCRPLQHHPGALLPAAALQPCRAAVAPRRRAGAAAAPCTRL